ncbi:hypothetical protein QQF64_020766 [Cirrhinus molitorella]|uniref:Uncharacterized protein n=1 Tax=Cirrhinus molitorella TaxID=172907 RepID=A0ABR3LCN5_9TELE
MEYYRRVLDEIISGNELAWVKRDLESQPQPEEGVLLWHPRARGGYTCERKVHVKRREVHQQASLFEFMSIKSGTHLRKVPFLSLRCSQSPLDPSPQRANQSTETVDRSGVRREEQIGQATPVYVIAEALSALFN